MRLFISLNLPSRSRKLLKNKVDKIKDQVRQDIKWVASKKWHLTLKFLGDTGEDKLPEIKEKIKESTADVKSFPVQFKSIGAFPHLNHPKVLFVDVARGSSPLKELNDNLESNMKELGFEAEDREYNPHLTIARTRDRTDLKDLSRVLKNFKEEYFINVYMQADKISLMESQLRASGPHYNEIFSNKLK